VIVALDLLTDSADNAQGIFACLVSDAVANRVRRAARELLRVSTLRGALACGFANRSDDNGAVIMPRFFRGFACNGGALRVREYDNFRLFLGRLRGFFRGFHCKAF
jgi:hypothetical protein